MLPAKARGRRAAWRARSSCRATRRVHIRRRAHDCRPPSERCRPGPSRAGPGDLDALAALEHQVFATDRIAGAASAACSPRRVRGCSAAECDGAFAGYALVLFRRNAGVARLYSIAVAPRFSGRRVGAALLDAAESAAMERSCTVLRLEVREENAAAVALYRKSGYASSGVIRITTRTARRRCGSRSVLEPQCLPPARAPPPYFHQTTEFTCGPACVMMALAWADPSWRPGSRPGIQAVA